MYQKDRIGFFESSPYELVGGIVTTRCECERRKCKFWGSEKSCAHSNFFFLRKIKNKWRKFLEEALEIYLGAEVEVKSKNQKGIDLLKYIEKVIKEDGSENELKAKQKFVVIDSAEDILGIELGVVDTVVLNLKGMIDAESLANFLLSWKTTKPSIHLNTSRLRKIR